MQNSIPKIISMTGFALIEFSNQWGSASWELKSVNHRFFEINIKVPEWLRDLEYSLRETARRQLNRGKVDCVLKFSELQKNNESLNINFPLVEQLLTVCRRVQDLLPTQVPISPMDILKWPNVLLSVETDTSAIREEVQQGFHKALEELSKNRAIEGAELLDFIKGRLQKMSDLANKVRERFPRVLSAYRERLIARLNELPHHLDGERLEQEVVYTAAKLDVAEELDRIATHLKAFQSILNKEGPHGRHLDFLIQELNREVNTLAAKSIDSEMTEAAIELKVLIEQLREQVQNIV